jgi:hypothetical protein
MNFSEMAVEMQKAVIQQLGLASTEGLALLSAIFASLNIKLPICIDGEAKALHFVWSNNCFAVSPVVLVEPAKTATHWISPCAK